MKFINFFVSRPVTTVTIFLTIVILGVISLAQLNVNLLPELAYPKLAVIVEYPGVSPQELENLVVVHIEASIGAIGGVKRVQSVIREGIAVITAEFYWSTQMDIALINLKEKVEDARRFLPSDCPAPVVVDIDPASRPMMQIVLFARQKQVELSELREMAELLFKPRLEQLKGVSRVEVSGGGEKELVIEVDPYRAALYGIRYEQIENLLRDWNQQGSGGVVLKDRERFVVKIVSEITGLEEFAEIPLKSYKNRSILLKDIATVRLDSKLEQSLIQFNGRRCLSLGLYREASGNTVEVSREVERVLTKLKNEFPDFELIVVRKDSELIEAAISNLKSAIFQGAILAFLILLLFFQNLRDPLLVVSITPVAIAASFFLMYLTRVQLNIMSLGGLALGVGMFIDNGIIVVENLYRHFQEKKESQIAATAGAFEVLPALVGANLTTMVIFLPVIYIYGISGRLFRDQALTINLALIVALIVSFTLLPTLFRQFSQRRQEQQFYHPDSEKRGFFNRLHRLLSFPFKAIGFVLSGLIDLFLIIVKFFNWLARSLIKLLKPFFGDFNRLYERFSGIVFSIEHFFLDRKKFALLLSLGMFCGVLLLFFILKKELLPPTSTSRFELEAFTQEQLGVEESLRTGQEIAREIRKMPGVKNLFCQLGYDQANRFQTEKASSNYLFYFIEAENLKGKELLLNKCRQLMSGIQGINKFILHSERNTLSEYLSFGQEGAEIKVFFDTIYAGQIYTRRILDLVKKIRGVKETYSNVQETKAILALKFKEESLANYGISKRELLEFLKVVLRGANAGIFRYYQKNYDVVLTTPLRQKGEVVDIRNLFLTTEKGSYKLDELIELTELETVTEMTRQNQKRYFFIRSALEGMKTADFAYQLKKKLAEVNLPAGISVELSGEEEERVQSFKSIELALLLSVILVFMTMAATMESLIFPLIIMLCIPMGLFGGLLFLFFSGQSLNIISGIGFLVASGIVVNDAIVKIECANQLRREGMTVRQAIIQATRRRLRPIILTTLTTIFGVLPMIYMTGSGTELQKPLAIVIAGSLTFSTLLTLIIIPVFYELVTHDRRMPDEHYPG